ncbi:MAG: hypothetical protein AB1847_23525, partial [bacterium]
MKNVRKFLENPQGLQRVREHSAMKSKIFKNQILKNKIFRSMLNSAGLLVLGFLTLSLVWTSPVQAQQLRPYDPLLTNLFFCPSPYCPFLPPLPMFYPTSTAAFGRHADAPINNTAALFPAPTLPAIPAATIGGVGVTTLIPTVPVTIALPASLLITNPLSPLITFTPLSLVGLTFAPVPVTAAP